MGLGLEGLGLRSRMGLGLEGLGFRSRMGFGVGRFRG